METEVWNLTDTFALFSIEILSFIKVLRLDDWALRTPATLPHWSVHLMDGLQHIFFQGCLRHDAVLHWTWFCYHFFALEFIVTLILTFRSQTLTWRFSLHGSLEQNMTTFGICAIREVYHWIVLINSYPNWYGIQIFIHIFIGKIAIFQFYI